MGVVGQLAGFVNRLAGLSVAAGDGERVDRIALLERLRGVVAAAQAADVGVETSQRRPSPPHGANRGSVEGSPSRSGWPGDVTGLGGAPSQPGPRRPLDVPAVYALLRRGEISEWAAQIVVTETRGLPRHVRRRIAEDLAPDLPALNIAQIQAAARRAAYTADPEAVLAAAAPPAPTAGSGWPAPDTMAMLRRSCRSSKASPPTPRWTATPRR